MCSGMCQKVGVIILAIVDGVFNAIYLLTLLFVGAAIARSDNSMFDIEQLTTGEKLHAIIMCGVAIIVCFCQIVLAWYLGQAARTCNSQKCRIWLVLTFLLVLVSITNVSLQFVLVIGDLDMSFAIVGIVRIGYKLFQICVVFIFTLLLNDSSKSSPCDGEC